MVKETVGQNASGFFCAASKYSWTKDAVSTYFALLIGRGCWSEEAGVKWGEATGLSGLILLGKHKTGCKDGPEAVKGK